MKPRLNILFLASWYPSKMHQTLGNFVQRHAEAVSKLHRVCVVTAVEAGEDSVELKDKGDLFEIIVFYRKNLPVLSYYRAMQKGIRKAEDFFPAIDLVHVHVAYPAGLLALNLKKPFVVTEHFSGYHSQSDQRWGILKKWMTRRILHSARAVMPVSQFLKEAIKPFAPKAKYRLIPNVVNTKIFAPSGDRSGKFKFLHISTLEEKSKNITGLLQGFKILEERGLDFQLQIGGDGDLEELNKKIRRAGIPFEKVVLISEKPIEGIAALMQQAHALVMFSHFETQSCTILEALCSGLPVVSSAVGGIPEILDETNGVLVTPNDPEALANGLEKMMTDYKRYHPQKISEAARSKYSYEAVALQIRKVYISALKKVASNQ